MKGGITITVSGPACMGKSTLATYLAGHLDRLGVKDITMRNVDTIKGTPTLEAFVGRPITIVEERPSTTRKVG